MAQSGAARFMRSDVTEEVIGEALALKVKPPEVQ
jgi:hypothetical protein